MYHVSTQFLFLVVLYYTLELNNVTKESTNYRTVTLGIIKATLYKIYYFHALASLVGKFDTNCKTCSKKVPYNAEILTNLEFKFRWEWLNKYLNLNVVG
jgi:hypothetical protein